MNAEPTDQDATLLARTRAALDASADELDYRSQLQLQRARQQALAALDHSLHNAPRQDTGQHTTGRPEKVWWQRQWLWLTAVPAALVLVIALPLLQSPRPASEPASAPALASQAGTDESWQALADLEVLADEAELEELADIEFYQWLGEQEEADSV